MKVLSLEPKTNAPPDDKHKETQFLSVGNKPPKDLIDSEDQIEETEARFRRRVLKLDEDTIEQLQKELYVIVEDWMESRTDLQSKLRDWNDLFEGVTEQTDFPWIGASQVHIPLPKIKGREIVATINRTTMRPVPFMTTQYRGPASLYDETKTFVKDMENFTEDVLKRQTNIHSTLKGSLPVIFRDGTAPIQIMWETDFETVTDYKLYDSPTDFAEDYPDADSAGLSQPRYKKIIDYLAGGGRFEIQYEYDVAQYDAPKAYIVPLIDFVHWPVYISEIKHTLCHGKRVWYTDYQLREKARRGEFDKDVIEEIIASGGDQREDTLTSSRDSIDGISRGTDKNRAPEFEFYELVYKTSLTSEDKSANRVRKHLIYYHRKQQRVVRTEFYPIRRGAVSYFPLRFIRRDGRLLGISLVDDISDLSLEADTIHRQRINSRTITHVPSFKAKMTAKSTFDPSRKEFRFRPGVTFYVADTKDVEQFDIRPVDLSGSVDEEMLLYQLVDMVTGSSSGLSGQSNPVDPRAPARKQQEMLRQSSNRIDDYVQNLLEDFEMISQFAIDLYYQFGPDRVKYFVTSEDGQMVEEEMDRTRLFNPNVRFKINGTSVFVNPEAEYERMSDIYNIIGADPITQQNLRIRRSALQRLLIAARVEDEKAFLPTPQEMPQAFTTDADQEREAEAARNRDKLAAKLTDAAARRDHELKMAQVQAHNEQDSIALQSGLDALVNGNGAPGATPSPGAPAPLAPPSPPMPGGIPNAA